MEKRWLGEKVRDIIESSKCNEILNYHPKLIILELCHIVILLEKEEKLAKHFIPYASGGDWGPYEFEGTYGVGPHTHVVKTAHRQPGYGVRRALLKR